MDKGQLIQAVKEGDLAAIKDLIESGADVNQEDESSWTPLNWAAGRGDVAIADLLLKNGADLFNTGIDQRTPYMIALAAAHVEMAKFLKNAEKETGVVEQAARKVCKAYRWADICRFEAIKAANQQDKDISSDLLEDDVVFIHQDLTVTRSIWHGEQVLYDEATPQWETFCREILEFKVPGDIDLIAS